MVRRLGPATTHYGLMIRLQYFGWGAFPYNTEIVLGWDYGKLWLLEKGAIHLWLVLHFSFLVC